MKRINVVAALMLAALFGVTATATNDRVVGEKLDSGLGGLSASYTAAEFNRPGWVRGESMDSGLGNLPPTYTAAEFMPEVRMAQGATRR